MKIHCLISDSGAVILTEEQQASLKVFAGQNCVCSLDFEESSDVQAIATAQSLEVEVVQAGLAGGGMEEQSKRIEPDLLLGRKATPSVLVETEFLLDFLTTSNSPSTLRQVMSKALCYTTVVQISEVLEQCRNSKQRDAALALCSMVRPLGVPPRYALNISFYLQKLAELGEANPLRFALSASISQFSKVPVLTVQYESLYSRLDIPTIKPESLRS